MLNYNCLHLFRVFRTLLLKISILTHFWAQNGGFGLRKWLNLITSIQNISGCTWNVHRNLLNYICLHFFGSFRMLLLKKKYFDPILHPKWEIRVQEVMRCSFSATKYIHLDVKCSYKHVNIFLCTLL